MSDSILLMFLSPQVIFFVAVVVLLACWVYFGWVDPISKLRDKNNKSKGGATAQLIIVGIILPALIFWGLYHSTPKPNNAFTPIKANFPEPPKTSYAAPPAPSANMGSMTAAPLPNAPPAPVNRPAVSA